MADRPGTAVAAAPPTGQESPTPDRPSVTERTVRWFTADRAAALALAGAVAVFVGIRLGPSLLGARIFLGLDVLRLSEPWDFTDAHPVTSFWYGSDHIDAIIPALKEVHARFLDGHWASWSNLSLGGIPLLSVPTLGVLTPSRWVYLLLPTWLAPAWSKLLELAVGSAGSYLFARRLNASKLAAALGGVVYPLTGFMIGWNNYPQVAVGALIPALFWSVERFLQGPLTARAAAPVAVVSALLLFGGFPAVAGQAFYVVGGYALLRLAVRYRHRRRELAGRFAALAAAVAVGLGISAVQLLPFTHQVLGGVDLGYRSGDFFGKAPYVAALSSLLPQTFGQNALCCGSSPQDINTYLGAVVLFLVLLGVVQAGTGRLQRFTGVYLVGVIVLVLVLLWLPGWWTNWMDNIPVLHGNPIGRIRSQLGVPIAVLAAGGVDFLRSHRWVEGWWPAVLRERRRVTTAAAGTVCVLVAAFTWRLHSHGYPWVGPVLTRDALIAGIPIAVIAALSLLRRARGALLVAVMVGVVVQGLAATSYYWPSVRHDDLYPTDPAIGYLQSHLGSHDRIATTRYTLRANATAYYDLRALNGHGFFDPALQRVMQGIDPSALLGATYAGFTTDVGAIVHSPGLDRMGVQYLVAGVDDVFPHTVDQPVPIPGDAAPLPPAAGSRALAAGRTYQVTVPAGALRGISLPLTVTSPVRLSVTVRRPDGSTVASDARRVGPGSFPVTVPLAADPGTPTPVDPVRTMSVSVSVDGPGATASTDAAGRLRLQAVRPPATPDSVRLVYAGSGLVIWQRRSYLPRIRWADHARVVSDPAARVQAVTAAPTDPGGVILSAPGPQPVPGAPGTAGASRLDLTRDAGGDIAASVTTRAAGYLVVADTIQHDFVATVDGHRTPIRAAEEAGGAVYVPAGEHRVRIQYAPLGRPTGEMISAGSGVLLLLALAPPAWFRRGRRRRAAGDRP